MAQLEYSLVIPTFNAASTITDVLEEVFQYLPPQSEVVVVNDGSTDDTREKLQPYRDRIRLLEHQYNRGYGAALKTGIKSANGRFVITFDSDGQHRGEDIAGLTERAHDFDMVCGIRTGLIHSSPLRMPGKWLINLTVNLLSPLFVPDPNCGLRLFCRETMLQYIHLCSDRFSFTTTSLTAFLCRGRQVHFHPVKVRSRLGDEKSTVTWRTGVSALFLVFRLWMLFHPLKLLFPLSLGCTTFGLIWGAKYFWMGHGLSVGALLFLLTGLMTFFFGLLADQISSLRLEKFE